MLNLRLYIFCSEIADFQTPPNPRQVPLFKIMKPASTLALLASLLAVSSVQAKWSRVPIIKEKPVDIAVQGSHSSASLDSSSGFGQVDALLTDDITKAATVSAGRSSAVINLGKPVLISQSSFTNDGLEGRATLSASADKSGWAVLEEKVFSAADRTVEFKFAGIQAKFIKLEFALSKGGMLRNLTFFGSQTDKGYAVKQSKDGKSGSPMNLLGGLGGARVVYAAPRPANGMDTAVTYNRFSFPESDEKYRTIIYDFGQLRILNEFASVHSPRPVRFEVFAFDNLPEKEDWRGRLAFDPAEFNAATPVAVAEDTQGLGTLKARPSKAVKTRYLALRWEPDFNPPDFQATGSSTGNVTGVVSTTTTVTKNADGTTTTVTVEVGEAFGAGAGSSSVEGDNAQQQNAQNQAAQGDSVTTTTTVTAADGTVLSTTVDQGNTTTTTTNNPDGSSTSTSQTSNSDGSTTTTTTNTDANGNSTTTTTTTDANGNTTPGAPAGSEGVGGTPTNSDGNLGGGSPPYPGTGGATSQSGPGPAPGASGGLGGGNDPPVASP